MRLETGLDSTCRLSQDLRTLTLEVGVLFPCLCTNSCWKWDQH